MLNLVDTELGFLFTDAIGAKVGLALSQAMIVTGMLQYGLLRGTEVVSQMTAVERVLEYTTIQKEPELESPPGNPTHWLEEDCPQMNGKLTHVQRVQFI